MQRGAGAPPGAEVTRFAKNFGRLGRVRVGLCRVRVSVSVSVRVMVRVRDSIQSLRDC